MNALEQFARERFCYHWKCALPIQFCILNSALLEIFGEVAVDEYGDGFHAEIFYTFFSCLQFVINCDLCGMFGMCIDKG